jgi:hypothetical protein
MSLRKTAKIEAPHAVFTNAQGWTWKVLKVNQPKKTPTARSYATWYCAVQSPFTYSSFEYGDTYAVDVIEFAEFQTGTEEFKSYLLGRFD